MEQVIKEVRSNDSLVKVYSDEGKIWVEVYGDGEIIGGKMGNSAEEAEIWGTQLVRDYKRYKAGFSFDTVDLEEI